MKLNKNALALTEGLSEKLIATVTGDGDKTVTWSSNNPSVATVDANGRVTAVKEGTAVITATVGGKAATCTVTVSARHVPPVDPPEEKPDPGPEEPENPGMAEILTVARIDMRNRKGVREGVAFDGLSVIGRC